MKREMARQEKVFSFMDELMEQYEEADSGIQVVSCVAVVLIAWVAGWIGMVRA